MNSKRQQIRGLLIDYASYAETMEEHIIEGMTMGTSTQEVLNELIDLYPISANDLIRHHDWDGFIGNRLGNDLFINDPERADRIHEAAKHGASGSTHAEAIQDQIDFLHTLNLPDWSRELVTYDLAVIEEWHEENGSLDSIQG